MRHEALVTGAWSLWLKLRVLFDPCAGASAICSFVESVQVQRGRFLSREMGAGG
jgi:hypothetical protein